MKCHREFTTSGRGTPPTRRGANAQRHIVENWSFIWTDSKGGAPKHQNQCTHAYYLSDLDTETENGLLNQSFKDLPRPLILKPQTSRDKQYLVSRPLVSLLSFWELSHFQSELCVASIFHTSDNAPHPPNPALPLSFSSSIVSGSEIQAGTASPAILSSSQVQYLPALLISSQTLRWWINHNIAHTHIHTNWHQEMAYLSGVFLVILQNFWIKIMLHHLAEVQRSPLAATLFFTPAKCCAHRKALNDAEHFYIPMK